MHPAFHVASHRPLSRYGTKVGSLQEWVSYDDVAANRGAATFPKNEVRKSYLCQMFGITPTITNSGVVVAYCAFFACQCGLHGCDHLFT